MQNANRFESKFSNAKKPYLDGEASLRARTPVNSGLKSSCFKSTAQTEDHSITDFPPGRSDGMTDAYPPLSTRATEYFATPLNNRQPQAGSEAVPVALINFMRAEPVVRQSGRSIDRWVTHRRASAEANLPRLTAIAEPAWIFAFNYQAENHIFFRHKAIARTLPDGSARNNIDPSMIPPRVSHESPTCSTGVFITKAKWKIRFPRYSKRGLLEYSLRMKRFITLQHAYRGRKGTGAQKQHAARISRKPLVEACKPVKSRLQRADIVWPQPFSALIIDLNYTFHFSAITEPISRNGAQTTQPRRSDFCR